MTARECGGQSELFGRADGDEEEEAEIGEEEDESGATSARAVEEKIEGFAEDLGRLLGTAQAKASSWLEQRKNIADQLTQIRDTANDYLQRLSGEAASVVAAVRRGRAVDVLQVLGRRRAATRLRRQP